MAEADATDTPIPDAAARMIASQYHGGQATALYSLASCGAIDLRGLHAEYVPLYADPNTQLEDLEKLDHLGLYFMEHGDRGPVEGWSELWGQAG